MEDKQKVIFIEDDPNLGLIIVLALQSKDTRFATPTR